MGSAELKKQARIKRKKRIRKHLSGTKERPRLSVFRSAKHIYAQIIDDVEGNTMVAASSVEKVVKEQPKFENKVALANFIGKLIGERAVKKGVNKIVFDRNGFLYHGRVKAVSEGDRTVLGVAVVTENGGSPCGACRQVLVEFAGDVPVLLADTAGNVRETTLHALLPDHFGPENLPHS